MINELNPALASGFLEVFTEAKEAARQAVGPHLSTDDTGLPFPYGPDDVRRLKPDAPQRAMDAAALLVALHDFYAAAHIGDVEAERIALFGMGWFGHEVLSAADFKTTTAEALLNFAKEEKRRRKLSDAAKRQNEDFAEDYQAYQQRVDALVSDGFSYTKATEEVAAEYKVSAKTVQRHTENKNPRHGSRHKARG